MRGWSRSAIANCDRRDCFFGGIVSPTSASVLRLLAILLLLASTLNARAAEPSVGIVSKVENEAEVVSSDGTTTTAVVGTILHMKDELRTGANGRLQVTFRDNTVLTLGEKASVIDRYVFDPDAGVGEAALNATKGALRFATGRLAAIPDKKITVSTPVAALGVRGTEFWFGQIGNTYGALDFKPTVLVSNKAGTVTLSAPRQGTFIVSNSEAPGAPKIWTAEQVKFATESTAMHPGADHHKPSHRGENGPGSENPQYAVASSAAPLALSVAPIAAFLISTNKPVSP